VTRKKKKKTTKRTKGKDKKKEQRRKRRDSSTSSSESDAEEGTSRPTVEKTDAELEAEAKNIWSQAPTEREEEKAREDVFAEFLEDMFL
jgi:molecular chaperone GrpE (heat shock protein)